MDPLVPMLGVEHELDDVARTLRHAVHDLRPATVGAYRLTCSDESEQETIDAFQRNFVKHLLPSLKFAVRSPFRTATLGGRYEWGTARLVENHFTTPESADGFKVLVLKINSHVSKDENLHYGRMQRYHVPSYYCGALKALLDGGHGPALDDLREAFHSEGFDRLGVLREMLPEQFRALAAAMVNARLQARKAVMEIQDFTPSTPTLYFVQACVTLNQEGKDSEVLVGFYEIDRRGEPSDRFHGFGDDPSKYRFRHEGERLYAEDDHLRAPRPARDHRQLIRAEWSKRKPRTPQLVRVARAKGHTVSLAKPLLKTLMGAIAEVAPVPAALFLFAEGLVGVHHAWRAHRLAHSVEGHDEAHRILREFEERTENLPPERAHDVVQTLFAEMD